MINYNDMENVIQALNIYVDKMQNIADTQKKLDEAKAELSEVKTKIANSELKIEKYTEIIINLETKHDYIKSQFETVLQDYIKLHSAFELLNIEIKKINIQNQTLEKSIEDLKSLTNETKRIISDIQQSQKETIKKQIRNAKITKICICTLITLTVAVLITSIIGLFI